MTAPAIPADGTDVPGRAEVRAWVAGLVTNDLSESERLDRIRALEDLQAQAAAAQARLSVGLRGARVGQARRFSPHRGARAVGLAQVLVREMPHTLRAMEAGTVSEWRATILARETACLSREDRAAVDADLLADPEKVEGWGDRRLAGEARKRAYALDPHAAVERNRLAEAERRVTVRPAPDTMTYLTALLPVAQGVAVWATLGRIADGLRARGDGRSRGQIMADTLVERVTGQASARSVPVAVNLTISDETLLNAGTAPAWLDGLGPLPAGTARDLVASARAEALASLRRLYVTPTTGSLVAMESRSRRFPPGLARFIDLRDQACRTPWCNAPIRHHDHVRPAAEGGPTTVDNGEGLCQQCNHDRQDPTHPRNATGPPGLPPPSRHLRSSRAEVSFSRWILTA